MNKFVLAVLLLLAIACLFMNAKADIIEKGSTTEVIDNVLVKEGDKVIQKQSPIKSDDLFKVLKEDIEKCRKMSAEASARHASLLAAASAEEKLLQKKLTKYTRFLGMLEKISVSVNKLRA
mmetsp:Transcript_10006/g.14738  ORF Transcript_10006/g.14738 Transcript_10006/m.14738 type:complete len:121 (-) Transcript_10006:178-540(-)